MFQLKPNQTKFLDTYESAASFRHVGGSTKTKVRCEIKDKIKGEVWASGVGGSESDALDDAINNANPGEKPMTAAEMADKIKKYREKFGDLDDDKPAKKSKTTKNKSPESEGDNQ